MTIPVELRLYIAMDERGEWTASSDASDALKMLVETAPGGLMARVVKLKVKMTPPEFTRIEVGIPDEAGEVHALAAE